MQIYGVGYTLNVGVLLINNGKKTQTAKRLSIYVSLMTNEPIMILLLIQ